jgi:prolyl oligopeptidase PreP (S9A serine peptidase family)
VKTLRWRAPLAAVITPVLIRVETRAGHGAGKPVWMQIDDFADQWAFLANWLQMTAPAGP